MYDQLTPIDSSDLRPIREIVYENIRTAILKNHLNPGDHLVESNIAKQMNISRTPIREALYRLQNEGLVQYMPRRGIIVKGIDCNDASEIYDIREVLDGLAVRLACERIKPNELEELKDLVKDMEKAIGNDSIERIVEINNKFNDKLLEVTKSKMLINLSKNLTDYLTTFRTITLSINNRQLDVVNEHMEIVNAIENGNIENGEKLARIHVKNAKNIFMKEICMKTIGPIKE